MASRVEELRQRLIRYVFKVMQEAESYARDMDAWNGTVATQEEAEALVDSFIAAVVEREGERIRKRGIPVSNVTFSPDGKVMRLDYDGADQMPSYFIPFSVLPPKEK